jgi:C1A family cysteine protease
MADDNPPLPGPPDQGDDNQTPPDPLDQVYAFGALEPTKEQLLAFPRAEPRPLLLRRPDIYLWASFPPIDPLGQGRWQYSCVAWAVGYALRSYYLKTINGLDVSKRENVPSPAYIYNYANGNKGPSECMKASMDISAALDILKAGVVSLADMPYDPNKCSPVPDVQMRTRATKFPIKDWAYIVNPKSPTSLEQIKQIIAAGHPVVFGINVAKSFGKWRGRRGGIVYSRQAAEQKPNKHAMVLMGYNDYLGAFSLYNSWGRGWGDNGCAWMAYGTFSSDVNDAYIIYP